MHTRVTCISLEAKYNMFIYAFVLTIMHELKNCKTASFVYNKYRHNLQNKFIKKHSSHMDSKVKCSRIKRSTGIEICEMYIIH